MGLPNDDDVRLWKRDAGVILVAILAAAFGAAGAWAFCAGCSAPEPLPEPAYVVTEHDAGDASPEAHVDPPSPTPPCDCPPMCGGGSGGQRRSFSSSTADRSP